MDVISDVSDHSVDFAFSAVLALILIIFIGINILNLLSMAGKWKIYTKAGEAGWKSLIPLYSTYMDFRISWNTAIFPFYAISMLIGYSLIRIMYGQPPVIAGLFLLTGFIISFIRDYKLSRSFGHGMGFALGLILIRPLFTVILGFGRSRYLGPQSTPR